MQERAHCGSAGKRERVEKRDGGLFHNMLFPKSSFTVRERGDGGQNAAETGFSEPSPEQSGEGRRVCLCRSAHMK